MIREGSLMRCIKDKPTVFTKGKIYKVLKVRKSRGWYVVTTDSKRINSTCRLENVGNFLMSCKEIKRNLPSWW
jgi:hypothetical protein